jgi:hypothetical protein
MNLETLKTTVRRRLDDLQAPYLWSNEDLAEYANDAEREACRRARLIVDSTTAEIVSISLGVGASTYDLDQRILFIKRVKVSDISTPLRRVSFRDLDRSAPGWEDETGTPQAYVPDMDEDKLRVYPIPTAAATATLTVNRLPLEDMANDTDTPEIKPRYHDSLVYWMEYRAYSKQDAETRDDQKAAKALSMFEQEFGKKSSAIDEAWIAREHGYTDEEGVY